ncbi:MAG: aminopeptidase [bacterium]|nr:aminopeptidase [bacterium]
MITAELKKAADIAVLRCMGVKAGESVLIVVDTPQRDFGPLFAAPCLTVGAEPLILEMTPRESHGEEPPEAVARAMLGADVILMPTSKSLSHTAARLAATQAGARIASLPMITPEVMGRTLVADYDEIERRNERLLGVLAGKSRVRLSSPAGTDLTFSIEGRTFRADGGINHRPGDFANLPAGEVYAAPVEGTAAGILVVDGSMAGLGLLAEPIELVITDGSVVEIRGGEEAEELERLITPFGWDARNVAELGIGTNETATITGNVLEDEKVLGTCHVALGDNSTFGGRVSVASHLDGIVRAPTLEADGEVILGGGGPVGW